MKEKPTEYMSRKGFVVVDGIGKAEYPYLDLGGNDDSFHPHFGPEFMRTSSNAASYANMVHPDNKGATSDRLVELVVDLIAGDPNHREMFDDDSPIPIFVRDKAWQPTVDALLEKFPAKEDLAADPNWQAYQSDYEAGKLTEGQFVAYDNERLIDQDGSLTDLLGRVEDGGALVCQVGPQRMIKFRRPRRVIR